MEGPHNCAQMGRFGKMESDVKTIFKRIDEQLTITKAVYELAAEVRVMNERMENMTKAQQEMREDLDELKAVPTSRFNSIITAATSAVVGGLIAFILFQIGLKP